MQKSRASRWVTSSRSGHRRKRMLLIEIRKELANEKKYQFGTAFCERHTSFKMEGGEEIKQGRKGKTEQDLSSS